MGKACDTRTARNARKARASGGPGNCGSASRDGTPAPHRECPARSISPKPGRAAASAQDANGESRASRKARILVVDDHPVVRQGLARLIGQEPDLEVSCEAEDVRGALDALAASKPDLAIVDISLKQSSGLELIKHMKARRPHLPVLALSMHDENLFAVRVLRAGASGYVMKDEAPETLLAAIRRVLRGDIHVSDRVASGIVRGLARGRSREVSCPVELLSDRELEVFLLIGEGTATRQIADALHLGVKTIETHKQHIKAKLGLRNAGELVLRAVSWVQDAGARRGTSGPPPAGRPR